MIACLLAVVISLLFQAIIFEQFIINMFGRFGLFRNLSVVRELSEFEAFGCFVLIGATFLINLGRENLINSEIKLK